MNHKGLNQLLCAAVVNERFREALLRNPAQAIAAGYFGQSFSLTAEEHDLVITSHARKLEDLAARIYHWTSGLSPVHGEEISERKVRVVESTLERHAVRPSPILSAESRSDLAFMPVAA